MQPLANKPLPTSMGKIPSMERGGQCTVVDQEKQMFDAQRQHEREAVVSQPYRTLPVVQPSPKTRHDYPTGSYLKYCSDPSMRNPRPAPAQTQQINKLEQVMNNLTFGVDPEKVQIGLTYNSPIDLYSNENAAQAINLTPQPQQQQQQQQQHGNVFSPVCPVAPSTLPQPTTQDPQQFSQPLVVAVGGQQHGGGMQQQVGAAFQSHMFQSANKSRAMANSPGARQSPLPPKEAADITLSPTYQLVQEQEQGKHHGPVKDQLYQVSTTPESMQMFVGLNVQQSHTFNALTNALLQHPRV